MLAPTITRGPSGPHHGLTVSADCLIAAWKTERVYGEFVADGASELIGDIILRERSVPNVSTKEQQANNPTWEIPTSQYPSGQMPGRGWSFSFL